MHFEYKIDHNPKNGRKKIAKIGKLIFHSFQKFSWLRIFINDFLGYDEYFSSYLQKKIEYVNLTWIKCGYTIISYIILTEKKNAINSPIIFKFENGLEF